MKQFSKDVLKETREKPEPADKIHLRDEITFASQPPADSRQSDTITGRKGKGLTDKHGFPILDGVADLQTVFESNVDRRSANNFAALFEEESFETALNTIVKEKEPTEPARHGRPGSEKTTPQSELDLHGRTAQEAEDRTESFILSAVGQGLKCIRIITGKGLHSEGPPVLPAVVENKLRELQMKKLVRSFQPEKRSGGSIVVLLR